MVKMMDLSLVKDEELNDLEVWTKGLLGVMDSAKLQKTILAYLLNELQRQTAMVRQQRFDEDKAEYKSYQA